MPFPFFFSPDPSSCPTPLLRFFHESLSFAPTDAPQNLLLLSSPSPTPCAPSPSRPRRRAQQWRRGQRRHGLGGARSSGGTVAAAAVCAAAAAAAWARRRELRLRRRGLQGVRQQLGCAAAGERGRCSPHPLLQRGPLLQVGLRWPQHGLLLAHAPPSVRPPDFLPCSSP